MFAPPNGLKIGCQVAFSFRFFLSVSFLGTSPTSSLCPTSFASSPVRSNLVFSPHPRIYRGGVYSHLVCSLFVSQVSGALPPLPTSFLPRLQHAGKRRLRVTNCPRPHAQEAKRSGCEPRVLWPQHLSSFHCSRTPFASSASFTGISPGRDA